MASATSFSVQTTSPARASRELAEAVQRVQKPSGALVFASGRLSDLLPDLGKELARVAQHTPMILAAGSGVLTERGEVEGDSAIAGVVWSGGRSEAISVEASSADDLGDALARAISDRAARTSPTVVTFVRPEGFGPTALEPLHDARGTPYLFGGGTTAINPLSIDNEGRIQSGRAAALLVRGLSNPVVRSSPACKLLTPLRRVTETRGALVTGIDGEPALDVLSGVGKGLEGQPLIFVVIAHPSADPDSRPELLVRAVQGVDPVRRGLLISDEVHEGTSIAFAIRDAKAARSDLESTTRDVGRAMAGAAPRFGIYVNCVGRGASLYGVGDVDTKILRSRFTGVPFAGLQSSFEIAPHGGRPSLQLYTGVVALFSAPS